MSARIVDDRIEDDEGTVLDFTDHARERMLQRNISADDVMDVYKNPTHQQLDPDHEERRSMIGATSSGKRIKIVLIRDRSPEVLVTVFERN